MTEYRVFIQAVRESAGEDGPRREERMITYTVPAESPEQATAAARARFELEHGGSGWAAEGLGLLSL
ncbi:MAG: hypothetical protein AB1916_00220 [Thermodesulfobacteriota bacterium]